MSNHEDETANLIQDNDTPNLNQDNGTPILGKPFMNDGIDTEDMLGYKTYADVFSYQLNHVTSPLTIGIFAKWGSGKSFLLKLTKDSLANAKDTNKYEKLCSFAVFALLSLTTVVVILIAGFVENAGVPPTVAVAVGSSFAVLMLLLCICGGSESLFPDVKLLFCAAFTRIPRLDAAEPSSRKFIYVDFNAWKHGGSDDIWAAIVTSIVDRVEEEIGTFSVRLFRSINFKASQEKAKFSCLKHFKHFQSKICFISPLYLFLATVIVTVLVSVLIGKLTSENKLSWIPSTAVGALGLIWATLRSIYALMNSQTTRISRALNLTKQNMSEKLGFMKLVKDEVMAVSNLIRSIEYIYEKNYKIVLAIDDLDRVTHDKVRAVLDAVNILLSDQSSPFFCLIAVDPVIAVNSIDERCDAAINVTKYGHEYLKKIINVPFCIPETTSKVEMYIASMVGEEEPPDQSTWSFFDQNYASEVTRKFLQEKICQEHLHSNPRNIKRIINVVSMAITFVSFHNPEMVLLNCLSIRRGKNNQFDDTEIDQANQNLINLFKNPSSSPFFEGMNQSLPQNNEDGKYFNVLRKDILEVCKLYPETAEEAEHVVNGTRNIAEFRGRRATVEDVQKALTKDFCENLTLLILMIEQWPFMTSLLLQHLDDKFLDPKRDGRKVFVHKSLYTIYKEQKMGSLKPKVAVDWDHLQLESMLIKLDKSMHRLNTTTTGNLRKYAINFDPRQMQTYLAAKETVSNGENLQKTQTYKIQTSERQTYCSIF